jgi:hypothetical protein
MSVTCILIAPPRSGTTVLGHAVTQAFAAAWPQEIFNGEFADPAIDYRRADDIHARTNFFNYRHEVLSRRPELSYPTKENQAFLFRGYLDYISGVEKAERLLIDVKYTSLHHLNSYWNLPQERPGLIAIVRDLGLPVIHLQRRNLFALYCSLAYAEASGVWVSFESKTGRHRIAIDTARCLKYMGQIDAMTRYIRDWFFQYPVAELEYETMLRGESWSDEVRDTFSRIFGMPPVKPLSAVYRKVAPPLREVVTNPGEVLVALRGTPYQAMTEEALDEKKVPNLPYGQVR